MEKLAKINLQIESTNLILVWLTFLQPFAEKTFSQENVKYLNILHFDGVLLLPFVFYFVYLCAVPVVLVL